MSYANPTAVSYANRTTVNYANGTIASYNRSAVKRYNTTSSPVHFEKTKMFPFTTKNAIAHYNAGVVLVNLKVLRLAPQGAF
jgi:hypothetical protein